MLFSEPKEHKSFLSGGPTGKTGDQGDQTEFYVLRFCSLKVHNLFWRFPLGTLLPKTDVFENAAV